MAIEIIEIIEPRRVCSKCGASNYPSQGKKLMLACLLVYRDKEDNRVCYDCKEK